MTQTKLLDDLKEAVIRGEPARATAVARQFLAEKGDPVEAIERGLKVGIAAVGDDFGKGLLFLPDLVLAAEALKAASAVLEAEIVRTGVVHSRQGKVVLGTVNGDLHDIGKTIVATLLTANGFEVIDLGVNVSAERFIEAVRREKPDVVGMSSLLTTTARELAHVIAELKAKGLRDQVKVVVGGGSVTQPYADTIEADGYGRNAALGVQTIKRLLHLE